MKAAKPGVSRTLKIRPLSSKVSGWMVRVKLRFFSSGSASRRDVEPSGLARLASAARRKASTRAVFPAPSAPRRACDARGHFVSGIARVGRG
jgi:hypothetical protein